MGIHIADGQRCGGDRARPLILAEKGYVDSKPIQAKTAKQFANSKQACSTLDNEQAKDDEASIRSILTHPGLVESGSARTIH